VREGLGLVYSGRDVFRRRLLLGGRSREDLEQAVEAEDRPAGREEVGVGLLKLGVEGVDLGLEVPDVVLHLELFLLDDSDVGHRNHV
jgi:hypothetical protein